MRVPFRNSDFMLCALQKFLQRATTLRRQTNIIAGIFSSHVVVIVMMVSALAVTAQAQFERRRAPKVEDPEFSIGLFGNLNTNIHSGDFSSTRSVYVCEQFTTGVGAGPAGGVEMMYNFTPHYGSVLRLGYGSDYAAFLSDRGQISLITGDGNYIREHVWRPSLSYGTAELLFDFTPVTRRVQFVLGPTLAYNLGKAYTQEEHIITTSGKLYFFPNGTDTWIVDQGNLTDIRQIVFGAEIGIAMEFKISRNILFTPNAFAHYFLQSPSTLLPWTVLTFKLGASFRYVTSFTD